MRGKKVLDSNGNKNSKKTYRKKWFCWIDSSPNRSLNVKIEYEVIAEYWDTN